MGLDIGNSRFIDQVGKMWGSWNNWHAQYQKDIQAKRPMTPYPIEYKD